VVPRDRAVAQDRGTNRCAGRIGDFSELRWS